jgi:hypothetical protein
MPMQKPLSNRQIGEMRLQRGEKRGPDCGAILTRKELHCCTFRAVFPLSRVSLKDGLCIVSSEQSGVRLLICALRSINKEEVSQ